MYLNRLYLNQGDIVRDRYKIIRELGRGGFGITYLAEDIEVETETKFVALKQLRNLQQNNEREIRQIQYLINLQREVDALKELEHDRIPQYIDDFTENNYCYIVQDYIEGNDLIAEIIPGKETAELEIIQTLSSVLKILEFIHRHQIIHRDIKPANLIRRSLDNKIVLIDFGAAKEISTQCENSTGISLTRAIGSQGYMPYEQWNGNPQYNSDLYALGIIALQMITNLSIQEIRSSSLELVNEEKKSYQWESNVYPHISDRLTKIVAKMVKSDFQQRYQSAGKVLRDLHKLEQFLYSSRQKARILKQILIPGFCGLVIGIVTTKAALNSQKILTVNDPPIPPPLSNIIEDSISSGEEVINQSLPLQKEATELYAKQEYQAAFNKFLASWEAESKDPQTLIYLNNTLLELSGKDYDTLAVAIPMSSQLIRDSGIKNIDLAYEMLRGVAQAQTGVNLGLNLNFSLPGKDILVPKQMNGKGLKIIIADDGNNPQKARKIARKLIARSEILGVIGNYSSDTTAQTIDIFNEARTTLISPGSTSEYLTKPHRQFFFRTIPTVTDTGEELANYLMRKNLKQAVILYNPHSPYTNSIREEFKEVWEDRGGNIIKEYDDLQNKNFDVSRVLKAIEKQKDTAIVLFPDGQVTHAVDNSLKIIAENQGKNIIVGGATLYNSRTLKVASIDALKKLVVAVPWHPLSSPNLEFTKQSKKLWEGKVNHRTALAYDATQTYIHALTKLSREFKRVNRITIQETIANGEFNTQGAIGTIRFNTNGNRRNPFVELVKVIPCNLPNERVNFVPIDIEQCSE